MSFRSSSLALCLAMGLACSSTGNATGPLQWADLLDWSVHIVTRDADGDERVTRIWIVVHDGQGAIRTGDSVWAGNIERGSAVAIRAQGVDSKVSATPIDDLGVRRAIDAEFARKYGWQETAFIPSDRAASEDRYFRLVVEP